MRILIAVPTFENITPDTFKSIYNLKTGDYDCDFDFVRGYDCATARNNIAQKAISGGYDYVMMVDNDITLPEDALLNLLETPVDICLGYYGHRNAHNVCTGKSCVGRIYQPDGKKYFNYPEEALYTGDELTEFRNKGEYRVQIHGGGMGCAMINVNLFKLLTYPWFDWVNYANKGVLSEDLFLCEKCKTSNIPIYVDTRVGCGHLFRRVQWI